MSLIAEVLLIDSDDANHRLMLETICVSQNLSDRTWITNEDLMARTSTSPAIVLSAFPSSAHKSFKARSRIRQNHIEFVDIFTSPARGRLDHTAGQLAASANAALVSEALNIAEQKILQRVTLPSDDIDSDLYVHFNLVGRSANFVKAMRAIKRVAQADSRVIIRGESGTGKEVAARAIHHFSPRSANTFVPINCGAFNDDMLLSELFGYKKGAFTGAFEDRVGLLEHANEGTVFLDEVDALSQRAQVSLLRFLQENEIRAVGGRTTKKLNVRVIAASNKNLKALVNVGSFREDLLYRLDVLSVHLPALRQRGDDLKLICQHILAQLAQELDQQPKYLSQVVLVEILRNKWRGNFRELESALLRAYLSSDTQLISDPSSLSSESQFDDIPRKLPLGSFSHEKNSLIRQFESEYIQKVLTQTGGNVTKAAEIAQKERRAFTRLMAKHGIHRGSYTKVS
jgi:DNA-binding NtrC family response regulator